MRVEPWPVAVAGLLLSMIGVCLAFWWIASRHPDPVLPDASGASPGVGVGRGPLGGRAGFAAAHRGVAGRRPSGLEERPS